MINISRPFISVPGDDTLCTMAKLPHLHSFTSCYALWSFGWPLGCARATQFRVYNPLDFTWVISDHAGHIFYTTSGSPQEVFKSDNLLHAWLSGSAREDTLNDITARAVRKANMRVVA